MTFKSVLEKIKNNETLNNPRTKNLLFITAFVLIFLRILSFAWCCDDAYHAYVMSVNLLAGKGFTPTPGIRVNVSTCSLWTLVVTLGMIVWNNPYAIGMIFNLLFSGIALFMLFKLIYKKDNWFVILIVATAVLCTSKTYLSYTTSGLENAQILMLSSFYLTVLFKNEYFSKKELFKIAILEGLIAFTRMDCALIFALTSAYVFLFKYKKDEKDTSGFSLNRLVKLIPIAIAGLSPFILWELFSFFYFGSFVPNTALAKLNTGFPLSDYLIRGVWYGFTSMFFDASMLLFPIFFIGYNLVANHKDPKLLLTTSGIVFYLMYIFYIGGDFMLGRHFLSLFWITLFLIFIPTGERQNIPFFCSAIILLIFCSLFQMDIIKQSYYDYVKENSPSLYADEQQYYYSHTGLIPVVADYSKHGEVTIIKNQLGNGIQWFYGRKFYKVGEEGETRSSYEHRLLDPLLARLPGIRFKNWRVGHVYRKFPEGYLETIFERENRIEDPDLAFYYSKLKFILSANLLDFKRLHETIKFNMGVYDQYLYRYINRHNDLAIPDEF